MSQIVQIAAPDPNAQRDSTELEVRVTELEKTVALLTKNVDLLVRAHPKIDYGRFQNEQ